MEIKGKTALVTGSSKRIGKACALELARRGAHIIVHYKSSEQEALETAEEIQRFGVESMTIRADLEKPEETEYLFYESLKLTGCLDILVNSASIFPASGIRDAEPEEFIRCSRIHTLSPLILARKMGALKKPGVIINFLDARVTDYDAEHFPYHVSKRELLTLTKALSIELAPQIRVNAVAPGLVLPPPGEDANYLEKRRQTNLLQRIGTLDEITDVLLLLIENNFITGQVIFVDGGRHLRGNVYG